MVSARLASVAALVANAVVTAVAGAASLPRIDAGVYRALRTVGTVDLIVTMKQPPKPASFVQEAAFGSRSDMIADLVARLEKHADVSQASLRAVFAQESLDSGSPLFKTTTSFWISNQVFVEAASPELVEKLRAMPSIGEVREQLVLPLPRPIVSNGSMAGSHSLSVNEWGVAKIGAPNVWTAGNTGNGVVVSNIDTGVLSTHEALKGNFRRSYGWYDPGKKTTAPTDENGHGTHTMGTITGANGIGVAPGAQWIACRGCASDGCTESDLLACAQFITCPTDVRGENKDCSKAPHVVSNSWGGGQGDTFYKAAVDAWEAAGIIPIFANGNDGPECTTASSPGDYANVVAVGATDSSDALASFSSKGPSKSGLLKPEISAPGSNVRSAWNTGDTAYKSISGTSMATPHVTGVVALLLSANPNLKFADIKRLLTTSADTALQSAGKTCGGTADGTFPNNNFGYGRVNALKAVGGAAGPVSPEPSTSAPSHSPAPTASTPTPSTPSPTAPAACANLGFDDCTLSTECEFDWDSWSCVGKP